MARNTRNNCLDRWVENVISLETKLKRRHVRSKCDVTLQEALCKLQERRAPPVKPVVPLHTRKTMPRQLAPLHVKSPSLSGKKLTSASPEEDTLLLRSVLHANLVSSDRSQLPSFPRKPRESSPSFLSSTGPNYASSRLKMSTLSSNYDQSSPFQHPPRSDPFRTPFAKGPIIRKGAPLLYLQRPSSPMESNQTTYLMRTSQIQPQPRPPNPLGSKANYRRRRKLRNEPGSDSLVGAQIQHGGSDALPNHPVAKQTCLPASPSPARDCAVRVDVPEAVSTRDDLIAKSNRLQPNPTNLVVPVITIRTATPTCPPGLAVPTITIRTATPMPGDPLDPPTMEGTETDQLVDQTNVS